MDHMLVNSTESSEKKSLKGQKFQKGFRLVNQYTVDTVHIFYTVVSPDGTLWIGDHVSEKILHIKISDDISTTLSSFNIKPNSLAISPSGSPLIVVDNTSTLKIINELTGQTIDSEYSINPWILSSVHTAKEENIIVGGFEGGKGVVIVMDKNGKHLSKYDKDKQLFTYPEHIATTGNGNIFVSDCRPINHRGRLVIIKERSGYIKYYNGQPDINSDIRPFYPRRSAVTSGNNVLVVDFNTQYLHLLNNDGNFITYYTREEIIDAGVTRSFYSLALSHSGNILIGCFDTFVAPKDSKATLYELECFDV